MSHKVNLYALSWLILISIFGMTTGTIISSSRIVKCVVDGGNNVNGTQTNCNRKMVVTMAVSSTSFATTQIQAAVGAAVDEESAESLTMLSPLTISISMTPITILYPFYYLQSVNGNPYEVVQTHPLTGSTLCEDGALSNTPSCGWVLDGNGNRVVDSQGYCCRCSVSDVFGNSDYRRGSLNCDLFGNQMASSHCLRFGDSWWSIYELGNSLTWYSVNIDITQAGRTKRLVLNPSTPIGRSDDRNVSAILIGNMAPSVAIPTFSDKYLAVPTEPSYSRRVTDGLQHWMFVDRTKFDLTGRTCNKIGVSYGAFNSESNKCANRPGNCLQEQLDTLWMQDIIRKQSGLAPTMLLERYGKIFPFPKSYGPGFPTQPLGFFDPQLRNVLLQLEINADDLIFVSLRSTGSILSVTVEPFPGQTYGGKATVIVFNSGLVPSDYYTQVINCSDPINPVPAQKVSIAPYYSAELTFDLVSRAIFSVTNQCNVTLYDSEFGFLDSYLVEFNTTDRLTNNGTQGTNGPPLLGGLGDRVNGSDSACNCGFMDFPCYIFRNCWSQFIGILITAAVIIVCAILLCKCGPRILRLLKPGKGGKSKKKSPKTIKIKTEQNDVEMEEYSQQSSLAAGKAPTPMSTPKKPKAVSKEMDESITVVTIPKKPVFSSALEKPISTEAELRLWSQRSRLVYLNVDDETTAKKFSLFPGTSFSVAGAVVEFQLPAGEGIASPWSFELCVGFENQKWFVDADTGKVKPVVFPLVEELSQCLNTVLDTATATRIISKRPLYPCINMDASKPELTAS